MRLRQYIRLRPGDVESFVHAAEHCDFDVDVANEGNGRYVVDAKSFLGVMGLNLGGILVVSYNGYNADFENYLASRRIAV